MTATYKIRLVRNGNETEIEGDKKFVTDMLSRLEPTAIEAAKPIKNSGTEGKGKPSKGAPKGKITSIREFIQQLEFKKHTDITLAFGYFIEHYTEATEFTPADIINCYYEAKIEASNTTGVRRSKRSTGSFRLPSANRSSPQSLGRIRPNVPSTRRSSAR